MSAAGHGTETLIFVPDNELQDPETGSVEMRTPISLSRGVVSVFARAGKEFDLEADVQVSAVAGIERSSSSRHGDPRDAFAGKGRPFRTASW